MVDERKQEKIQWDIPSSDGSHSIHLSPETLHNQINQLTNEVILHRAAIHELLVLSANLLAIGYLPLRSEKQMKLFSDIQARITASAKAMRFENKGDDNAQK